MNHMEFKSKNQVLEIIDRAKPFVDVDKGKLFKTLGPELMDIIRRLSPDFYVHDKISVIRALAQERSWQTISQISIEEVNARLEKLLAEKKIHMIDDENPLVDHFFRKAEDQISETSDDENPLLDHFFRR